MLERGVTHGEDLVDEEHVRLEERRDPEPEPHLHPHRVELHEAIDGMLEAGELDDLVEAARGVLAPQTHQRRGHVDVLSAAQLRRDSGANLDHGAGSAGHLNSSRRSDT